MTNKKKQDPPLQPDLPPPPESSTEALYRRLHDPMSFDGLEEKIRGEEILMEEEHRKAVEEKKINELLREKELDRRLSELKDKIGGGPPKAKPKKRR